MRKNVFAFSLLLIISALASSSFSFDKAYLRWQNQKPSIDSIVINGNANISTSEIKSRMYAKESSFFRRLKNDRRSYLQRETIGRDTLEIKYLYYTNGYLGIQIREDGLPFGKDSTAMLWVNIAEGRQFVFGDIKVSGDFKESFRSNLSKIAHRLKFGKPANPLLIRQHEFEMKSYLANNGYPYATITTAIDTITSPPNAHIAYTILTDSLVRFGQVTLEAMKHYPPQVAFRELKLREGDIYKRDKIIQSQKRLYESGYFTYAQLSTLDTNGNRLNPNFQLRLKERKPYFTSVTTGAGQSEFKDLIWDFSFGIGKRNFRPIPMSFWGSHRINLSADYSFTLGSNTRLFTHRYRLRYTLPWFFNIRMPVSFTGEWEPPLKFEAQDFTIRRYAFSISSRKWFGDEIRIDYGMEYENIKITDVNVEDINLIKQEEGISVRRQVYTSFRFDSRDHIFLPTKGSLSELSVELFGGILGGDDNFYRVKGSWATYQKVWPGWILATRIKGGLAREFGASPNVPSAIFPLATLGEQVENHSIFEYHPVFQKFPPMAVDIF